MIIPPERSPDRDAAIDALLAVVPSQGWTYRALRSALSDIGADPHDAEMLFPGGAADMIEAFIDLTDRRMEQDAAATDMAELRLPDRVRAIIAARLARLRPHKEAVRRAMAMLALPRHTGLAARCTARTVDAIWHAAGDRSADFSWYTKRAILAAVYASTLLYWLGDHAEDDSATLAFLDRRLGDVGQITRTRKRVEGMLDRIRPGTKAA